MCPMECPSPRRRRRARDSANRRRAVAVCPSARAMWASDVQGHECDVVIVPARRTRPGLPRRERGSGTDPPRQEDGPPGRSARPRGTEGTAADRRSPGDTRQGESLFQFRTALRGVRRPIARATRGHETRAVLPVARASVRASCVQGGGLCERSLPLQPDACANSAFARAWEIRHSAGRLRRLHSSWPPARLRQTPRDRGVHTACPGAGPGPSPRCPRPRPGGCTSREPPAYFPGRGPSACAIPCTHAHTCGDRRLRPRQ